ncbi:MAG: acetolactate synthase small subunit [Actinobacteria bacterium]|nr:MAG: acetolactate synthase small subunit [Actinomycetota bacterium]
MKHTISVVVEDKPGVLARVSAMFSNRGFNIHSLAVGPTHIEGRSRITLVCDAPELEQLQKQLHKLVNVIKVHEFDSSTAVVSEVMLARVACDPGSRGAANDTGALFGARVVDLSEDSITFEVAGDPDLLQAFIDHMTPFGIVDLVKSGRIAMKKQSNMRPAAVSGMSR